MSTHVLTLSKGKTGLKLSDESGAVVYSVLQEDYEGGRHVAQVQGPEKEVIATMEFFDDLKFYVAYGTSEKVEMDKWAHESSLPFHQ